MAKDELDELLEAASSPAQSSIITPSTQPSLLAGPTHWFEGSVVFGDVVKQLVAEGKLPKNEYTLPLPYLSISQVELYQKCPMQFYYRYILGKRSPPGISSVQGTNIHKAVEVGYRHVMDKHELPQLELSLDAYSDALDKNLTSDVVWADEDGDDTIGSSKDKGKVKDQGVKLLQTWHQKKLPRVTPKAVEKSFVTTFAGIPVVGVVDLIDRINKPLDPSNTELHPMLDAVVDNKVVSKKYAQSAVDNKLQMTVYSHASGLNQQRYDLFVKTKTPKLEEMLTSRNPQDIRWAVKTFQEVAKAISAGIFPMCSTESWACSAKWCGYWSICRGAI